MAVQRSLSAPLAAIALNAAAAAPLYRQLYLALRDAILGGRLAPGVRLPSTRSLAAELGVSRNTTVTAFEQLHAEGYLEGRVGSGSYVAATLPEALLQARRDARAAGPLGAAVKHPSLSKRGAMLAAAGHRRSGRTLPPRAFAPGLPALDEFPFDLWARLLSRRWRRPPPECLAYGDPAGYRPLRESIAGYLGAARGVNCDADQVIVVSGGQQALDLVARLLLDPGDAAWIEEPGYPGARGAMAGAGVRVVPVPVDREGLDVAAGARLAPDARLVTVCPSHQYPLGVTMSLARRLELLEWAGRTGAWIVEDDYDSEYRYAGRPLAALQGLDRSGRVIYIGTFSKVMFPALRLGYLIVPPQFVPAVLSARTLIDEHPSTVAQTALADFIAEGYFNAHVRRMRALYAGRQAVLVDLARPLAGRLEVRPHEAGMHLVGWLPRGTDDQAVARRADAAGVDAPALSGYHMTKPTRPGLLLGFAGIPMSEIRSGLQRLDAALGK